MLARKKGEPRENSTELGTLQRFRGEEDEVSTEVNGVEERESGQESNAKQKKGQLCRKRRGRGTISVTRCLFRRHLQSQWGIQLVEEQLLCEIKGFCCSSWRGILRTSTLLSVTFVARSDSHDKNRKRHTTTQHYTAPRLYVLLPAATLLPLPRRQCPSSTRSLPRSDCAHLPHRAGPSRGLRRRAPQRPSEGEVLA